MTKDTHPMQPVDYKIIELAIVTKSGMIYDLRFTFDELNIFDSLFMPVISGNIVLREGQSLPFNMFFDGSESLLIEIEKIEDNDFMNYKRAFRIYKQGKRTNDGLDSQVYTLYFISDEQIYSDQQRISQFYESRYSGIVENLLNDKLAVPGNKKENVIMDESNGIKRVVVPNLTPLEAIQWCTKRAVDDKKSPNFVFYENKYGFNFAKLSTLLPQESVLDIKFQMKNTTEDKDDPSLLFEKARALEIVEQIDGLVRTRMGTYAGTFKGFDPITGDASYKRKFNYDNHWETIEHGNDYKNVTYKLNREKKKNIQMYDSRISNYLVSQAWEKSAYIKSHDASMIGFRDDYENYILQRQQIFSNLMSKRVKVALAGNFSLTSGYNVNLIIPMFSTQNEEYEDLSTAAKYLIVGTRHVISFDRHQTIIEVASTSTRFDGSGKDTDSWPNDNWEQTRKILEY